MSFLDRIKGNTGAKPDADAAPNFNELAPPGNPMEATIHLGPNTVTPPNSRLDAEDGSIISEAAPSELAGEFPESQHLGGRDDGEAFTSGLPVVGTWALARQQRAMLTLFFVGLAGLLITSILALTASNRSAAQVGAAGQATTQSQRLAKSV